MISRELAAYAHRESCRDTSYGYVRADADNLSASFSHAHVTVWVQAASTALATNSTRDTQTAFLQYVALTVAILSIQHELCFDITLFYGHLPIFIRYSILTVVLPLYPR